MSDIRALPIDRALRIELLGDFRAVCGEELLDGLDSARLQSLLAYLVLHSEAPQRREHLAFLFWPDSDEKQARTNLRQLLHHLRQALPESDRLIESSAQIVQWRPGGDWTLDVAEFEQALARSTTAQERGDSRAARRALEEAIDLYHGDLVPSCYDDWIEPERARLREAFLVALERLVGLLEAERAYRDAIRHCRRLIREDALREASYRTLMRLHAANRDRAGALRTYHECTSVLERELGIDPGPETVALYERLTASESADGVYGRTERERREPVPASLVGRHGEWSELQAAWDDAAGGAAHFVTIGGVAGIGKSRLAEEQLHWCARAGFDQARARCYAAEGRLAYGPVAEWLRSGSVQPALRKLSPGSLSEVARILPELVEEHSNVAPPTPLTETWQRRRFFEALARAILATGAPLALLVDDLQWSDRETLEWLRFLLHFEPHAPLLVIGTFRSEEVLPDHPLNALQRELRRSGQLTEIELGPLDREETAALARLVAGRELNAEEIETLFVETEGVPLFVVEQVRAGLPSRTSVEPTPRIEPSPSGPLPPGVRTVITSRLAQLSPPARQVAELAATIGRDFRFDVLSQAGTLDEGNLVTALDELWQRRIVREHGVEGYDFSHDRLREVAYAELTPARRRLLHRRVAEALEVVLPLDPNGTSSQMAAHFELAGLHEKAIRYYQRAAALAQRTFADEEAIHHLSRALTLLDRTSTSDERAELECELQTALGRSLMAARGWAAGEAGRAHERARLLAERSRSPDALRPPMWGLQAFYLVRADLEDATKNLGELGLRLGEEHDDDDLRAMGYYTLGLGLFHLGELTESRRHLERAWAADWSDHRGPLHPGIFLSCYQSHVLWHLGFPGESTEHQRRALESASGLAHPVSQGAALAYSAMLHQFRNEPEQAGDFAAEAWAVCDRYGIAYYRAWAVLIEGWSLSRTGTLQEGVNRMRQGLADLLETGARLRKPYYLGLLAEAHVRAGDPEKAGDLVREALDEVGRTQERWCEPELHRLHALSLEQDGDEAAARTALRRAMDLARRQGSMAGELRAATELVRLSADPGDLADARGRLGEICDRYSEGFDAPDLREAKAVLNETA